jgi:hypothetical protein
MKNKITKEELIIANADLKHQCEKYLTEDQLRRREFAKAFAWYKAQQPYSYRNEGEPQIPTWEQIFVNVGYLTAGRDFRDYEGTISELGCAIEDIKKKLDTKPT